jgi:hypothetical protein
MRRLFLLVGLCLLPGLVLPQTVARSASSIQATDTSSEQQAPPEHFWIAGRYDGNKVIVYFDAVKFGNTYPRDAQSIAPPVAAGFLGPVELSAEYIARFQKSPTAERFSVGDKYDVLSPCPATPVTLTKLVGAESDEPTGNDSYIGALAAFGSDEDAAIAFSGGGNYLVLGRHHEIPQPASSFQRPQSCAGLGVDPVPFDTQSLIVRLLTQQMETMATDSEKQQAERISPLFDVHAFYLADGKRRYYARIEWASGADQNFKVLCALAAWIAPEPSLHVLASESRDSRYEGLDSAVPELLNVADLGDGRTAIIMSVIGLDSAYTDLFEYADGSDLRHMRKIQSIGAGE